VRAYGRAGGLSRQFVQLACSDGPGPHRGARVAHDDPRRAAHRASARWVDRASLAGRHLAPEAARDAVPVRHFWSSSVISRLAADLQQVFAHGGRLPPNWNW